MNRIAFLSLLWVFVGPPCCRETPLAMAQPPLITIIHESAKTTEPITLEETKSFAWSGFTNAKIIDGKLIADVTSKPKFVGMTSQIILSLAEGYSVSEVVAEATPSMEFADVLEAELPGGATELSFGPDTKPGTYRITVKAQKAGVSRQAIKRLNVTIGGDGPAPPDVDLGKKSDVERIVDNAVFEIKRGYASVFNRTADEIAGGRIKTDADVLKFMVPISKAAREQAVAGVDGLIQDKMPRDGITIKPEASGFMREIAAAFERGLK